MVRLKKVIIILSIILVSSSVFANTQKYYPVSSKEWQTVNNICHYAGVVGPTSFGPVTVGELMIALDRAENVLGRAAVSDIRDMLLKNTSFIGFSDDFGYVNVGGMVSTEIYTQTNTTTYDNNPCSDGFWVIKDYKSRKPIVSLDIDLGLFDTFYGKFALMGKQQQYAEGRWNEHFTTNMRFNLTYDFPFEAGISLGGRGFNFIVARDKVSLGEGKTGNTAIGDVFDYQEFLRASYYARIFAIHLNLTSFDSSHKRAGDDEYTGDDPFSINSAAFSGWKQIRHSVDYEFVFFNKARFTVALITLLDTDSAFDIRLLNPMMVLHNMCNYHEDKILEANNMVTLDFSFAIAPKWNMYLQVTMDQLQLPGESDEYMGDFEYTDPNAFGALVNLTYTNKFRNGMLNVYAEAVANMPGMYLNEKYYVVEEVEEPKPKEKKIIVTDKLTQNRKNGENDNKHCWSQDFLLGYFRDYEYGGNDVAFAGYTYGPDCVVVALGAEYSVPNKFSCSSKLQYLAHGEKGRGTKLENYNFTGIDTKATVNKMPLVGESVEHTISLAVECEYSLFKWLSVNAGVGLAEIINVNFSGKNIFNAQFAIGATINTP